MSVGSAMLVVFALGEQRRDAAQRSADQHRLRVELLHDFVHVGDVRVHAVVAGFVPGALAVPAQVHRHRVPAFGRELRSSRAPREARLSAAMQQQHGRMRRIAKGVGRERDAVASEQLDRPGFVRAISGRGRRHGGNPI